MVLSVGMIIQYIKPSPKKYKSYSLKKIFFKLLKTVWEIIVLETFEIIFLIKNKILNRFEKVNSRFNTLNFKVTAQRYP